MNRRTFLGVIAGGLFAAPLVADAQTAAKKVRVGMLGSNPIAPFLYEMFKEGLAQLGYIEGHQVQIVQLDSGGVPARLPAGAAELVRARADVIFARGPFAVAAAVQASKTIPIVAMDLESDPIALGYAKTLARPGGNVTGVFLDLPELSAKQLQLLREIAPGLSRVALVGDSTGNAAQFPSDRTRSPNPWDSGPDVRGPHRYGARCRAGGRAPQRGRSYPHILIAGCLRPPSAHRGPRP